MLLGVAWVFAQTVLLAPGLAAETVTLRQGKMIAAVMVSDARSGKVGPGEEVRFETAEDVVYGGVVVIPKGSQGTLAVNSVKGNGMFGKPGTVEFGPGILQAGMQEVPVAVPDPAAVKGKSKLTKGLLFLVVGVLFVKGEEGGYAAGSTFTVEVAETVHLEVGP